MAKTDAFERALAGIAESVRDTARAAHRMILEIFPDAIQSDDGKDFGFGFATGYKGLIFVITPARSHVTLGVAHAMALPDPTGLLEGRGAVHRHVKLRSPDEAQARPLRALAKAALVAGRTRWTSEPTTKRKPSTKRASAVPPRRTAKAAS